MSKLLLTEIVAGHYRLEGELTFASLSQNVKQLQMQRPKQGEWCLDCQKITRIDSAGVAFLLDAIRYSEQASINLQIINLPKLAMNLIEAQGVATLIKRVLVV